MFTRFAALFLLAVTAAAQTTWYVDITGIPPGSGTSSDPYTSIQHAIEQAATLDGDVLLVRPGVYLEHVNLVGKNLELHGEQGAAQTIIDGTGLGRPVVFVGGATVHIEGLTLRGGVGDKVGTQLRGGGLIGNEGSIVVLDGCVVRDNEGSVGAGVYFRGAQLTILGSEIVENEGYSGIGDNGPGAGAGLMLIGDAVVDVVDSSISRNFGKVNGAGVCVSDSVTLTMARCAVEENDGSKGGYDTSGNGVCAGPATQVLLLDCTLIDNVGGGGSSAHGGGYSGPGRLERCLIAGSNSWFGGGVFGNYWDPSVLELVACTLRGNLSIEGGGAYSATLVDCVVDENKVVGWGGGARNCVLVGGVVRHNRAEPHGAISGRGGGLFACAAKQVLIEDNIAVAINGVSEGAGMYGGTATGCTIRRNSFSGSPSSGGGAYGTELERCTIIDNVADSGGGISDARATSCILWGNAPDQVIGGEVKYSTVEGGAPGTGNLSGDPGFWLPLAGDVHLKPTSPCIDSGDPTLPPDSDGSPADQGALPFDPGYCAAPVRWCVPTPSSNGCVPVISALGTPTLTGPDDLLLLAGPVRNQEFGWLLWSDAPDKAPFLGGVLCLGGSVRRSMPLFSGGNAAGVDCSGNLRFAFTQALMSGHGFTPGTTLYAQFVHRDPGATQGLAFSDALEFTLCP